MNGIRLLAIAPSGETYVAEIDGRTWLIQPPGAGDPQLLDRAAAELAVTRHGFDRVDRMFGSPEELEAYQDEVAGLIAPDVATRLDRFDEDDVREMLVVARRWRADGDPRGARLARRLVRAPVVRTNPDLLEAIAELLETGGAGTAVVSPSPSEIGRRARERYLDTPAAA